MSQIRSTRSVANDERQRFLFDDAPEIRVWRSDEKALRAMGDIVEQLESAKAPPWSARLLGWQLRTFDVHAEKVTPIEVAALRARLDEQLKRLGPPRD